MDLLRFINKKSTAIPILQRKVRQETPYKSKESERKRRLRVSSVVTSLKEALPSKRADLARTKEEVLRQALYHIQFFQKRFNKEIDDMS